MTARPRVLFVTYEASRTGSPLLLRRLLRWLHEAGTLDLEVVCWRGGPLVGDFAAVADTRSLGPPGRRTAVESLAVGAGELGLGALGRRVEALRVARALRGRRDPDLVYLNGVPSFVAVPHLGIGPGIPVLGHVHELEFALARSLPVGDEALLRRPDRFVAVSSAVGANLVERHGIDPSEVAVCHGFVDDATPPVHRDAGRLRAQVGIPEGAPVVGAMGDLIWRKGPDLFVQLAAAMARDAAGGEPPAHFVWVGGHAGKARWDEVHHDIEAVGLEHRVHLVGEQSHPTDWHALFDAFALTSREDPFPLVVLEAAQAGVPVVAFHQGGAPEVLVPADGHPPAGVLVEPLDVGAMAAAMRELLADARCRDELGRNGRDRVARRHVTSVAAPLLLAEMQALL